ncbi:glycosyltransferase [Sphingomonas sp. S1-29]|uniref:glycosyltransferase family 2 protein n=1 Tax=Sphingomonas sp. S1-29 TaxID=2991074 RepID=UPI00223F1080|nr:glycosyltransferase [Sphingomonas sp. S1-29]UZK68741.1 glycosyltransferase [Sphingomonas sp. S1-29]
MKYVFICTNYNNSHYTEGAVNTLIDGENPPALIVVVDNDSKKDQQDELRRLVGGKAGVHLLFSETNVGYFAGLNLGLHRALELVADADAYIVGNNDLEFPADFGTQLSLRKQTIVARLVVAPNIVTVTGLQQNPHAIRPISRFRGLILDGYAASFNLARLLTWVAKVTQNKTRRKDVDQYQAEGFIFMGLGACYILSRRFIDQIGELPAEVFLMHEEFFLSRKIAEKGEVVYYVPQITVIHHDHGSVGTVSSRLIWQYWRASHKAYRRYVPRFGRHPVADVLDTLQKR